MTNISGTFLKFVDPLLAELNYPNPRKPEFDNVVKIGWTVWNAVVKNDVEGDPAFLGNLKEIIPAPFALMTDRLIERKRKLFAKELYLIGNYEIRAKPDGSFTLHADARETKAARLH